MPLSHRTQWENEYRVGQKRKPYVRWLGLCLTARIFKTPEAICTMFGTLQRCFVLNTSIYLWHKMAPSGESQQPAFLFRRLQRELQQSAGCWIQSAAAMNRKTERSRPSLQCLPEQQEDLIWHAARHGEVSQAPGINELWRRLECVLQQKGEHTKHIFKWKNDVCAIDFYRATSC